MNDVAQATAEPTETAQATAESTETALPRPDIDEAVAVIDRYLRLELMLDAAIDQMVPLVETYVEERRFRPLARSMLLSGAGVSFGRTLGELMRGPTRQEREAMQQREEAEAEAKLIATIEAMKRETIGEILSIMGLRQGDQLVVQSSTGETRTIPLDVFKLPEPVSSSSPASETSPQGEGPQGPQ